MRGRHRRCRRRFRLRVLAKKFGKKLHAWLRWSPLVGPETPPAPADAARRRPTRTATATRRRAQRTRTTSTTTTTCSRTTTDELRLKTDPCNADTDGDGVEDGYEYQSADRPQRRRVPAAADRSCPTRKRAVPEPAVRGRERRLRRRRAHAGRGVRALEGLPQPGRRPQDARATRTASSTRPTSATAPAGVPVGLIGPRPVREVRRVLQLGRRRRLRATVTVWSAARPPAARLQPRRRAPIAPSFDTEATDVTRPDVLLGPSCATSTTTRTASCPTTSATRTPTASRTTTRPTGRMHAGLLGRLLQRARRPYRDPLRRHDLVDPDTDGDGVRDGADDQDHDDVPNLMELSRNAASGRCRLPIGGDKRRPCPTTRQREPVSRAGRREPVQPVPAVHGFADLPAAPRRSNKPYFPRRSTSPSTRCSTSAPEHSSAIRERPAHRRAFVVSGALGLRAAAHEVAEPVRAVGDVDAHVAAGRASATRVGGQDAEQQLAAGAGRSASSRSRRRRVRGRERDVRAARVQLVGERGVGVVGRRAPGQRVGGST